MRRTHTLATLGVTESAWRSVATALKEAGAHNRLEPGELDLNGVMLVIDDPAMCLARVRERLVNAKENGYEDHLTQTPLELAVDLRDRCDDLENYSLESIVSAVERALGNVT
jgi:hypothetical protein